jgi:hypothetical protein
VPCVGDNRQVALPLKKSQGVAWSLGGISLNIKVHHVWGHMAR